MASPEPADKPKAQPKPFIWLGVLIPLALILGAAAGYVLFSGNGAEDDKDESSNSIDRGRDYYVLVRSIELYPKRMDGKAWDRIDGSGPDIQFNLVWQDNIVFESKVKQDTLIGTWDALTLDLKTAILQGEVDLNDSIAAATIRIEKDTNVALTVWDDDLPGKDEAGRVELPLGDFKLGDNAFEFDAGEQTAVKRIVVRVIDKSLPVSELVEEAMRP